MKKNYGIPRFNSRVTGNLLLKMKLIVLFLCIGFAQLYASAFAQSKKLTLFIEETAIENVLREIEKETELSFLYQREQINVSRKVSVDVKEKELLDVLDDLFENLNISYKIVNKHIILTKSRVYKDIERRGHVSQERIIKGMVRDNQGDPLPGVNVYEKSQPQNGVITGVDGSYAIAVEGNDAILTFSFIGFEEQNVNVADRTKIDITLLEETTGLDEVVVVGYGTQSKKTLTGAVSNMKSTEIENVSTGNLSDALYGRMAGLNVNTWTGTPGVPADIMIRATSSWNNSAPIYVIDGIVRDKEAFNNLDVNEMDEISILKDAAAAAVYGSRAANGAVVVTTKKGKTGAPTISLSSSYSIEKPTFLPKMMENALEINKFFNDVIDNNPNHWAYWSDEELDWLAQQNGGKGWNWYEIAKEDPQDQKHSVNVSGGTEKVRYFFSGSFYDQKGIVDELRYKRYNLRAKLEVDVSRDLTVGLQLANIYTNRRKYNFQYDYGNDGLPDVWSKLFYYNWDVPAYIEGKPVWNGWVGHPIEHIKNSGYKRYKRHHQEAIFTAKYKVPKVKGLTAGLTYSKNVSNYLNKTFTKKHDLYKFVRDGDKGKIVTDEVQEKVTSSSPGRESLTNSHSLGDSYQLNARIDFDRKFGDHKILASLIYEQAESEGGYFYGTRYDYQLMVKDQFFATSDNAEDSRVGGREYQSGRLSYIGRINYDWKERYLVSATMRRDGSTIFAPNQRWGWFPSVSAGWRISEEAFFKNNIKFIDYLKVRGSYGILGDDFTDPYQWQETYSVTGGFLFGENPKKVPGAKYDGLVNPNITWEKSHSTNIGIDAAFINKRLNVVADLWWRTQTDILDERKASLPSTFGADMPDENYAEMKSKGWEVEIMYNDHLGSNFKYHIGANVNYAVNKVIKYDEAEDAPDYKRIVGRSWDYMYALKYTDIIRTQSDLAALPDGYTIYGKKPALGSMNFQDISGPDGTPDGKIDDYDQTVIADNTVAPYNVGFFFGGEYRGFSFDVLFNSAFGHKKMYNGNGRESFPGIRPAAHWRDAWSESNPNGAYPKAVDWHVHNGYRPSSFWLRSGAYLRLKNVNLAYRLPKRWTKDWAGIDMVKFYVNATNLFVISEFTKEGWYDPELPRAEYYPNMKKFTFGVNVTF